MKIITPNEEHIKQVSRSFRIFDNRDLENIVPEVEIDKAIGQSDLTWIGLVDGEIVFLTGVHSVSEGVGYFWVMTTPEVEKHRIAFLRGTRSFVREDVLPHYKLVFGVVNIQFEKSIKWLEWLGFEFGESFVENRNTFRPCWIRGALWQTQ